MKTTKMFFVVLIVILFCGCVIQAQNPEIVGKITDIVDVDISTTTYRGAGNIEYSTFHFAVLVTVNETPLIIYGDSVKELNEIRMGRTVFLDPKEDRYYIRWHMLERNDR